MLVTDAKSRDAWKVYLTQRITENKKKLADNQDTMQNFKKESIQMSIEADEEKLITLDNFFK